MGFGSKDFVFVDSLGSHTFFESSSLVPMVILSDVGHFKQAQKKSSHSHTVRIEREKHHDTLGDNNLPH